MALPLTPELRFATLRKQDKRWLVLALVLLAFTLRVGGLQFQSLWRDEVDSIRLATGALRPLQLLIAPGQNGPLYFLALRPWLEVAGTSEFALRFVSVMAGTLAVPLVYRLCTRLLGRFWIALIAAAMAATSPYLVWYSQEAKMYALVACVALVSTDCLLSATRDGGWQRWLGYVSATAVAFYLHVLAALLIPGQIAIFLALGLWRQRKAITGFAASLAALTFPYLPLLTWQLPLLLRPDLSGYRFVPFPAMVGSLISAYSLGVAPGTAWLLVPSIGLLLAGGLPLLRGTHRTAVRAFVSWFLVPVVCFFAITLIRPMYTARYLIFVLPALWLLGAIGAYQISRWSRAMAGACVAGLLAANVCGLWLQARTPLKADYRAATRFVAERLGAGDLVLFEIPYGRYSFDYYYSRAQSGGVSTSRTYTHAVFLPLMAGGLGRYRWADGPYTNSGVSPEELNRVMVELVGTARVVWLFESEAPLWDERGLVKAWLGSRAALTDHGEFLRVAVYRYVLP